MTAGQKYTDEDSRNAFVFLTQHVDLAPDNIKDFVIKASEHIKIGSNLFSVIQQANQTIAQSREEISKHQGAVSALLELCAERISAEDMKKYSSLGAQELADAESKANTGEKQ